MHLHSLCVRWLGFDWKLAGFLNFSRLSIGALILSELRTENKISCDIFYAQTQSFIHLSFPTRLRLKTTQISHTYFLISDPLKSARKLNTLRSVVALIGWISRCYDTRIKLGWEKNIKWHLVWMPAQEKKNALKTNPIFLKFLGFEPLIIANTFNSYF